jgi:hypothetical protein
MISKSVFSRLALFGVILTLAGCSEPTQPGVPSDLARIAGTGANATGGGTTLYFNGANANTSTPLGTIVTSQIDNIAVDAMVRFDGGNAVGSHQMIYYNGHGAVSGWGIIVLGAPHGFADGTIGILAGGIAIPMTNLVLQPGVWQHVTAERRAGVITVTLEGESFVIHGLGVNPVARGFAAIERTTVGGDGTFNGPTGNFNGAVDRVRVLDLNTESWIERWNFNEGEGATATGVNGTVLFVGNSLWAQRSATCGLERCE